MCFGFGISYNNLLYGCWCDIRLFYGCRYWGLTFRITICYTGVGVVYTYYTGVDTKGFDLPYNNLLYGCWCVLHLLYGCRYLGLIFRITICYTDVYAVGLDCLYNNLLYGR